MRLWRRLCWLFRRRSRDSEIEEEMAFHLEREVEESQASGLTAEQARSKALREFGNVALHKEDTRSAWGWTLLDQLSLDVRYGIRSLKKNPAFTFVAILTLAAGIGAATSVFTVVNGVLFEALPYRAPDELVLLFQRLPDAPAKLGVSPPDYEILRSEARSFAGMAAYRTVEYELSGSVQPRRLFGARVSPDLFDVLGTQPALGRVLTPADDREGARVTVLSHGLWSALGRNPSVVGQTIHLDRQPYTVVGVLPAHFSFPPRGAELNGEPAELFVPLSFSRAELEGFGMRYSFTVVARLGAGVSAEQARAEVNRLAGLLPERYPGMLRSFVTGLSIPVIPVLEETAGRSRRALLVLMGAVLMVLLVVCADLAGLLLTRLHRRRRELAIRYALGASPARVLRQLLLESLFIGLAGSALGLIIAAFAVQALLSLGGEILPRAESIDLNGRVVAVSVLLGFLTPLLFGTLPSLFNASGSPAGVMSESGRTVSSGRRSTRALGVLAAGQISLALVLSVGAGLLVRSFLQLVRADPGFRSENAVRLTVTLPSGGYSERGKVRSFYDRAVEALNRTPGVLAVGAGSELPLGIRDRRAFTAEAPVRQIPATSRLIAPNWVTPGYFSALGIPLKSGRVFNTSDPTEFPTIVINETLAKLVWPGRDPVGRRIKWGIEASRSPWMTVVGVVGDVKHGSLAAQPMPQAYVPVTFLEPGPLSRTINFVVRSSRATGPLLGDLRRALHEIDPALPVAKAQSLDEMVGESVRQQQFSMTVVSLFAIVTLALSALGMYGVLASVVSQQTHAIAVRLALGSSAGGVIRMIARHVLLLTGTGIGIGLGMAWPAARVMAGLLYEVRPTDITTIACAAAALIVLALLASLVPAWRAAHVDPVASLKAE
jgi:predicted permease